MTDAKSGHQQTLATAKETTTFRQGSKVNIAKNCTKKVGDNGEVTFSCQSKKWDHEAANKASMITIFVAVPIVLITLLSLNLGDKGIWLSFLAPFLLFFVLGKVSKRVDTITIEADRILINYVPYKKDEIGGTFAAIETPVDGTYVGARYKGNTIQVTGYFEQNQVAHQVCAEIRQAIAAQPA